MQSKKEIRSNFRNECVKRDNDSEKEGYCTCRVCQEEFPLNEIDVHHIIDRNEIPNGGYIKQNGICLCQECHKKAEVYHQTNGIKWTEGYHPDDLFSCILSCKEEAMEVAAGGKPWAIGRKSLLPYTLTRKQAANFKRIVESGAAKPKMEPKLLPEWEEKEQTG